MSTSKIRHRTGTLPSPRLERLATAHPFVHQIDVVFPSRAIPEDVFSSLKTVYATARFTLSELYTYAASASAFKAHPIQRDADDTWCIDPRGILTLSVSKTLYEKLGVVGKKVPFKACPDRYVIDVPLRRETTSVGVQARHRAAMDIWDRARASAGLGPWHVAFICAETRLPDPRPEAYAASEVTAHVRRDTNVHVPHVVDLHPETGSEHHDEYLRDLFEWVGMACLGAQRLRANDRVDPYVAVYEPVSPASVEDVSHVRWQGLMDDAFVRSVIDIAGSTVSQSSGAFVSVTLHSDPMVPVSYLPETLTKEAPPRVPGLDAEDTVCLVLSKSSDRSTYVIGESIGRWDARWG